MCTEYLISVAVTEALPTAEETKIMNFPLEDIFLMHGAPQIILTDF